MDTAAELIDAARGRLLDDIEAFLSERRVSATAFGQLAVNDPNVISRLRRGENMTTDMLKRLSKFLSDMRARTAKPEKSEAA